MQEPALQGSAEDNRVAPLPTLKTKSLQHPVRLCGTWGELLASSPMPAESVSMINVS